jgi:hypothetical protein
MVSLSRAALIAGLLVIAAGVGLTLSGSPLVAAASNGVAEQTEVTIFYADSTVCQSGENIPRGTAAIRMSIVMAIGGALTLDVRAGSRTITTGSVPAGWRGFVVTIPVKRVRRAATEARVCVTLSPTSEPAGIIGANTSAITAATVNGRHAPGRLRIEYLRPAAASWWSMLVPVARRMGLGRAWSGTGVSLLVLAIMSVVVLATASLLFRKLG